MSRYWTAAMHGARYYVTLLDDRIVTLLDGYYVTLLDIGLARYWPAEISHAIGPLITPLGTSRQLFLHWHWLWSSDASLSLFLLSICDYLIFNRPDHFSKDISFTFLFCSSGLVLAQGHSVPARLFVLRSMEAANCLAPKTCFLLLRRPAFDLAQLITSSSFD